MDGSAAEPALMRSGPAAAADAAPPLELELALPPDEARRIGLLPEIAMREADGRRPRAQARALRIIWHDTPDRAMNAAGLSVAECRTGADVQWRLERLRPARAAGQDGPAVWPPGTPAPLVALAADQAGVAPALPAETLARLLPIAGFEGQRRILTTPQGVSVRVVSGEVRAIAHTESVCRVTLAGEAAPVARLALTLAQSLGATIPCGTLAAEASAIAAGPRAGGAVTLPPRRLGAPDLPPGLSVDDAFAFIVAHLLDVILHYAPRALAGEAPEPVHQMRVAVRRLRSAFSLFKKHAACAELAEAKAAVKLLARLLGPPRDWDVFLAGTCAAVAAAVPDDPAVARLAVRARRRREAGYAALSEYLHRAEFRSLGLRLALLAAAQPWREMAAPEAPPEAATSAGTAQENASEDANLSDAANGAGMPPPLDLRRYAVKALHKRLRRVLAPGADIAGLPDADLHAIRLNGKRLRYAAEFFAPLFPGRETRRFLRRVTTLQERLGHLNDGAVASGLMAEIGQARGYVGGVVRGFVAAGGQDTRSHIGRSWKRFRKLEPFWE